MRVCCRWLGACLARQAPAGPGRRSCLHGAERQARCWSVIGAGRLQMTISVLCDRRTSWAPGSRCAPVHVPARCSGRAAASARSPAGPRPHRPGRMLLAARSSSGSVLRELCAAARVGAHAARTPPPHRRAVSCLRDEGRQLTAAWTGGAPTCRQSRQASGGACACAGGRRRALALRWRARFGVSRPATGDGRAPAPGACATRPALMCASRRAPPLPYRYSVSSYGSAPAAETPSARADRSPPPRTRLTASSP